MGPGRQGPPGRPHCHGHPGLPACSSRRTSYTYDDSFRDKATGRGLRAVEYLLVRKTHTDWVIQARLQAGAELLGETDKNQPCSAHSTSTSHG
ncbi:MAG: hypothetical protein ACOX9B_09275 [Candidatus Xenobium sp.]